MGKLNSIVVFAAIATLLLTGVSHGKGTYEQQKDLAKLITDIGINDKGDANKPSLYIVVPIHPNDWRENCLQFCYRWKSTDDDLLISFKSKTGRKIKFYSPKVGDTTTLKIRTTGKGSILIVVGNMGAAAGTLPNGNGGNGGNGQDVRITVSNGCIAIGIAETGGSGGDGKDNFYGTGGAGGTGGVGGNITICGTSDTNCSGYAFSGEGGRGGDGGDGEGGGLGGNGGYAGNAIVSLRNIISNPKKGKDFGTTGMAVSAFGGHGGDGGDGGYTGGIGGNAGRGGLANATAFVAYATVMGGGNRKGGDGGDADGEYTISQAGNGGHGLKPPKATATGGKGNVYNFKGEKKAQSGAYAVGGKAADGGMGGSAMPAGKGGNGGNSANGGDAAASSQSKDSKAKGGAPGIGGPPGHPGGKKGNDGDKPGDATYF